MDSKLRFSNRVADYVKYRPTYPDPLIDYLVERLGGNESGAIADVGSGTGIFTRLLLERGLTVYGVEPNQKMREAAEASVAENPSYAARFHSVSGSAEETTLPDGAVSAIVCAQAFHWFDAEKTKAEFQRVLRSGGLVALVWNKRDTMSEPFAAAYDALLHRYAPDYKDVGHMKLGDADFRRFFRDESYAKVEFVHEQWITREQLIGRAASSSYTPRPESPLYEPFVRDLEELFDSCQVNGVVPFHYRTELYYGSV